MLDFGFYNMDCMEGMKQFPDKYFDLAVVDPPYGGGNTLSEGGGVLEPLLAKVRQVQASITNGRTSENRTEHGVMRTGGTWARKFGKKLLRGTQHRRKNTLMNSFVSHGTRLSGAAIIFRYHRQDAF